MHAWLCISHESIQFSTSYNNMNSRHQENSDDVKRDSYFWGRKKLKHPLAVMVIIYNFELKYMNNYYRCLINTLGGQ